MWVPPSGPIICPGGGPINHKVSWSLRGTALFLDPLLPHNIRFDPLYYRQEFEPPTVGIHYPLSFTPINDNHIDIDQDLAFVPIRPANGNPGTLNLRVQWENQNGSSQLVCHASLFWGYYVNLDAPLFAQTQCPFA